MNPLLSQKPVVSKGPGNSSFSKFETNAKLSFKAVGYSSEASLSLCEDVHDISLTRVGLI